MEKYLVWCPNQGSGLVDGVEIKALDPNDAACIWAQREDSESADYWIVGGSGATIVVRDLACDKEITLLVTGEATIHYTARAA